MITLPKIVILAIIQGAAELLPVSSSAHVIVAEKLMGLDPTQPSMTLLLVMLHTGTMLAVIVFFWDSWKKGFFKSRQDFWESMKILIAATIATGFVGLALKVSIEKIMLRGISHPEVELLFGNLLLISASLAAAGALVLCTGFKKENTSNEKSAIGMAAACVIGLVQGICLPFRGFSRSGATISTGLILGIEKRKVEDFSFALAVILTPPVILVEALRFLRAQHGAVHGPGIIGLFLPSLMGMVLSFISGLLALKWLSNWLARGRWYLFGFYCLFASAVILILNARGL